MSRRTQIRSLPFRHPTKPALGFELFRMASLYERADHPLDLPQRPEFHTIYVGLRGRGELVIDFRRVPLGAGVVTFVARGRVQQFVPDRSVEAWMILFAPELVADAPVLSPLWDEPALRVSRDDARELEAVVELMEREQARPLDAHQPAILVALLEALLHQTSRLATDIVVPAGALARFFAVLERDHARTRSVAHYAKQAGVSPRRLGELLASHGKSPKQAIDERVVLELKRRLVHTDLSVKELADELGFAEPTNLVKFFRHHAKTTPIAFREANRRFLPSGRGS